MPPDDVDEAAAAGVESDRVRCPTCGKLVSAAGVLAREAQRASERPDDDGDVEGKFDAPDAGDVAAAPAPSASGSADDKARRRRRSSVSGAAGAAGRRRTSVQEEEEDERVRSRSPRAAGLVGAAAAAARQHRRRSSAATAGVHSAAECAAEMQRLQAKVRYPRSLLHRF